MLGNLNGKVPDAFQPCPEKVQGNETSALCVVSSNRHIRRQGALPAHRVDGV
jgi:hypothetical protein